MENRRSGCAGLVCLVVRRRASDRRGLSRACTAKARERAFWFGASSRASRAAFSGAARNWTRNAGCPAMENDAKLFEWFRSRSTASFRRPGLECRWACGSEFARIWVGYGTGFGDCFRSFGRDREPSLCRYYGRRFVAEPERGGYHIVERPVLAADGRSQRAERG